MSESNVILEQVKDVLGRVPRCRKMDRQLSDALKALLACKPAQRPETAAQVVKAIERMGGIVRAQRVGSMGETPTIIYSDANARANHQWALSILAWAKTAA